MSFSLELVGLSEARARIGRLRASLTDLVPLWERVGMTMAEVEAEWFLSEGEGSWPTLARTTLVDKSRIPTLFGPEAILVRRGDLFESLTDPAVAMEIGQGRSSLGTFTKSSMSWGTDVRDDRGREYAHFHQHLDEAGQPSDYGRHPPERQVIEWPMSPLTLAALHEDMDEFAREALRDAGIEEV